MNRDVCKRNSSFELLKIFALVAVILLHYNSTTCGKGLVYVEETSIKEYYLLLLEVVCKPAVDILILISSYFLCATNKRSKSKIVYILVQLIVFREFNYFFGVFNGGIAFDIKNALYFLLPVHYYIILYCVLYVISPYINVFIRGLNKSSIKKFTLLLFCLFSIETWIVDILSLVSDKSYEGLSTVGFWGSQNGYSIVNFILLYFVGACLHIHSEKVRKLSKNRIVGFLLIDLIILYSLCLIGKRYEMDFALFNYNNPLIIIFAVLVFILFLQMDFSSKIVNEGASASFTCYIVHGNFLPFLGVKEAVSKPIFVLIIHQMIVVISLYFLSYIVYKIYTFISRPILDKMCSYIPKMRLYEGLSERDQDV